jgi:hypothetical protein
MHHKKFVYKHCFHQNQLKYSIKRQSIAKKTTQCCCKLKENNELKLLNKQFLCFIFRGTIFGEISGLGVRDYQKVENRYDLHKQ